MPSRAPFRLALLLALPLTLAACAETIKEPVYQIEYESRMANVYATYPPDLTRAEAEAQGKVIYMVESTKRLVPCDGSRTDCFAKLDNMQDRISALGAD